MTGIAGACGFSAFLGCAGKSKTGRAGAGVSAGTGLAPSAAAFSSGMTLSGALGAAGGVKMSSLSSPNREISSGISSAAGLVSAFFASSDKGTTACAMTFPEQVMPSINASAVVANIFFIL